MQDPNGCTDAELIDRIGGCEISVSGDRRRQLRSIREFDLREGWAHDGARHMGQWLAAHLGITVSEGLRRTKAAHALEKLPLLSQALEQGVLGFEKICQLARFLAPDTEADEIRWAKKARFDQIKRKADIANRPTLDEVQAYEVSRYLNMWECDELGGLGIEGRLPAAEGALFKKAIEQAAAKVPVMPDEEPDSERANVDALLSLTVGRAEVDDADPDRATVVVHVDLDALVNADRCAEIEGGPVIAPEIASQLLCDSRLQLIVHGADGRVLGIGRASRDVPAWLRRQLMHRDGGCTFCGTKRYLQAHHIIAWEQGGPTDFDNLAMVCHFHHKLVHRYRWSVVLNEQQIAEWRRPDGTLYEPKVRAPAPNSAAVLPEIALEWEPPKLPTEWLRSPPRAAPGFG